ncbi:hypothetical protein A3860_09535 [Niastella vici]|uniref:Uncharacterized protein n=1 Tax=Niastella vici TaxID=1703345 RepID=A0A1V9FF16_9BACT|nr:hypothetical protein [Niastella vici]OQP56816.1 hypothetical protein A3860_09535 [Niastella vici]
MSTFLDLQNGWYNGFLQGMGQSANSFQIIQPAPPIASGTAADSMFWAYYNNLPPFSLTQQFTPSGGNQFYNNYRALMSALVPSRTIDVQADIGAANYTKWQNYILGLATPPSMNQLPTLFRNWAMIFAPNVANIGSSDYAAILLDPIATAQNELTLIYTDINGLPKSFNWTLSYMDMVGQLIASPSRQFSFDSQTMNSNVSTSWTKGSNSGFFGLWGGSTTSSSISQQFAASHVTVTASFDNVLVFANTPGLWYYSSAMGLAFANKTGNPWSAQSSINWNNTFGSNGNMQLFAANLIIASGMTVKVTSDASYSTLDQQTITSSGSSGFWPFYSGSSGSSSTNTATFNEQGQMTITTTSLKGVPVVLGVNVLPVAQFVGHSAAMGTSLYAAAKSFKPEKEFEKYA